MSGPERILRDEEVREIESIANGDSIDFEAMLECLGGIMSRGMADGRFTEKQVQHDMEFALWVAYTCNNIDDYEHYCTTVDWLSRVEDLSSNCGTWFYRYGVALMYTGKPRKAFDYFARGVEEEPMYTPNWAMLARMRSHYGGRKGALAAARKGLEIHEDDPEFLEIIDDIENSRTLEQTEFRIFDGERYVTPGDDIVHEFLTNDDDDVRSRAESVMGIFTDSANLRRIKTAVHPSGWIPDHPYCTFMTDGGNGQVLVSLAMNEAFLSKLDAADIVRVLDSVHEMESAARAGLDHVTPDMPLYALTIARDMSVMLSFGSIGGGEPVNAMFGPDLQLVKMEHRGGPFVAFVLLTGDSWDCEEVKGNLASDWGVRCREKEDEGNLVFENEGNLVAYSLFRTKVPDGEAEENAANNYMWPEAVETTRRHTSHLMVALVNHGMTPVPSALTHTKMVAAAAKLPNAIGVYYQGTVVKPEVFLETADQIREGQLPLDDWVWFGISRSEGGYTVYTRGMSTFGMDEMEVTGDRTPMELRDFLYNVAGYLLQNDTILSDGDEIGFDAEHTITVERSPGVAIDGMTLKLKYPE